MFYQTINVIKPTVSAPDRYGDVTVDWSNPTRLPIDHVMVQPSVQSEPQEPGRNAVVTGWHIISQPGRPFPVDAQDRIELYGGLVCEVTGEVAAWPDPITGKVDHYEVDIQRVAG
jgi:hypothetical protein